MYCVYDFTHDTQVGEPWSTYEQAEIAEEEFLAMSSDYDCVETCIIYCETSS